jgi:D-alanyl-D-alanine dipeptidase
LLLFDGYRPWYVTWIFWEATPFEKRNFVANPDKGSRHNRGCAIDLSLYDRTTGLEVPMPSGYDEFSERAHPAYAGGTAEQRAARDLLRASMEAEGFTVDDEEWWHYDCRDWQKYRIGNAFFKDLNRTH